MAKPADPAALHDSVLVLAPFGRDAFVVSETLRKADISASVVSDIHELTRQVRAGAGSVLLTQEALTATGVSELLSVLAHQPTWSDVAVLLLAARDGSGVPRPAQQLALLKSTRNVTVLQRPLPAISLVSALRAALLARHRQYEVRDLIARERLAREEAEAATRVKDEFLATVSHELRTPASAILLWAQLLESGGLNQDQSRRAVRAIAVGADSQSKLIEDLLDVSRMLTGMLRLELREREVASIALSALELVRPTAQAKGVQLLVDTAEHASVLALVDADRLQQVFWNLLSNAVKFTAAGGTVSLRLLVEAHELVVCVSDTGRGITAEFLPLVFERFRQVDSGPARRHGGIGLGLSIARHLVELHGGSIRADSDGLGKGSTFRVLLPTTHS
jgi:signal transduction histidine kinase